MKTEELVRSMKELVDCYEKFHDEQSSLFQEINYWRWRFLLSQNGIEGNSDLIKKYDVESRVFLATPWEQIKKKSPEGLWKELIESNPNRK